MTLPNLYIVQNGKLNAKRKQYIMNSIPQYKQKKRMRKEYLLFIFFLMCAHTMTFMFPSNNTNRYDKIKVPILQIYPAQDIPSVYYPEYREFVTPLLPKIPADP